MAVIFLPHYIPHVISGKADSYLVSTLVPVPSWSEFQFCSGIKNPFYTKSTFLKGTLPTLNFRDGPGFSKGNSKSVGYNWVWNECGLMTQFWLTGLQERFALYLKNLIFKERGEKTQKANLSLKQIQVWKLKQVNPVKTGSCSKNLRKLDNSYG